MSEDCQTCLRDTLAKQTVERVPRTNQNDGILHRSNDRYAFNLKHPYRAEQNSRQLVAEEVIRMLKGWDNPAF